MKRKGSRSDFEVALSSWENKVMGTESDKVLWKVNAKGRVLCKRCTFK